MTATDRAETFRRLHDPGRLLVLPNAWDGGSAMLLQSLGAEALATSSAALCWANGYPDGGAFPRDALLRSLETIARVARVPISVDAEAGYSDEPARVAELVGEIAAAGGVGINLEDGIGAPELLAAKIEAVKSAVPEVFVNARVDVWLKRLVPAERALAEAIARVERYTKAGCDGVFVPALAAPDGIRAVVEATPLPVNLLVVPGLGPVAELRALGVRRLSAGSGVAQAALGAARRGVRELLGAGTYGALLADPMTHAEMNALFA